MAAMDSRACAVPGTRGSFGLLLLLAMWCIRSDECGRVLPSAAPMILTFATINRNRRARGQSYTPTALFTAGYLLAWTGFGVGATLSQAGLERASLLAPMAMKTTSPVLGGLLLSHHGRLPIHAAQASLPRSLGLHPRLHRQPLARWSTRRAAPWASAMASIAWAAAGS